MTTRMPSASERGQRVGGVGLIGSAIAEHARERAVDGDEDRRRARRGGARRPRRRARPHRRPALAGSRHCRSRPRGPRPCRARPCRTARRSRSTVGKLQPALARRVDDRRGRADARCGARRSAASRSSSSSSTPPPASIAVTAGWPSVSVPVLSTTSVSTFSKRSSASAFLTSTPALRAAPDADHDRHRRRQAERAGAGDDQHGDRRDQRIGASAARARQATRPRRRAARRRSRPARTRPETRSASRWIGARLRCASRDHLDDPREHRVAADLLGAHDEAAGLVQRAADHAGRRRPSSTGIDSPVTMRLVDARRRPRRRRRRPAPFRRAARAAGRRRTMASSATSCFGAVRPDAPRASWARGRAARGWRRRSARARAARAPARAARGR